MTEGKLFTQAEEKAFRQLSLSEQQKVLLAKYQERNQEIQAGGIVLAGDSLTEFLPHGKLQTELPLYNRGIRGIGIAFLREHINTLILEVKPSQVVLLIGTNDLMFGMAPEHLAEEISELLETIQAELPTCDIYLQSLYPRLDSVQWGPALMDEIEIANLYLRNLSGITYIDMHSQLAMSNQLLNPDYTRDGVHLTMAGYQVVLETLGQLLQA
ncbi:GDSL-type esterase/lipase family protein [Streptococcus ovuberis]|uniref:Lipase n=1 Tax=Streptococcus ovuberis TaxID=1936207 RepID=A0A7X6MXN1_9STRE|nr:GDSL-type esterase/lipase family protein [Streptococcus ovuberis]NKZ19806.1 lipase [Streptococcus ovuberis]